MNHFRDKLDSAAKIINQVMSNYANPAILCSFGKDSLVMLHMLQQRRDSKSLPIIYYRQNLFPKKNDFANRMISEWELKVIEYPASGYLVGNNNATCEVIRQFVIGQKAIAISYGNLYEPDDGVFACGLRDMLQAPVGGITFQWDALFCGHKSSDKDPLAGDLSLKVDIHQSLGNASLAYPLRHWTDEDVWTYIRSYGLPFDENRYDENGKDKEDKTYNPDWLPACTRCINKFCGETVRCPKNGMDVTNIGKHIEHFDMKMSYYGAKN